MHPIFMASWANSGLAGLIARGKHFGQALCVSYRRPHIGRTCFWNERDDIKAGRGGDLPPPTAHGREE